MNKEVTNNVLIIEDNRADIATFKRGINLLDISVKLEIKRNGIIAREYLEKFDSKEIINRFELILLDLNLPGIDGRKLLENYFNSPELSTLPVIVISTSTDERDIKFAYKNGANAYVIKPGASLDFLKYIESIFGFWINFN